MESGIYITDSPVHSIYDNNTSKLTKPVKSVTHNQKKKQSIKIDSYMTQTLKLTRTLKQTQPCTK